MFVILKAKIINHQENVKIDIYIYIYIFRLGWIGPWIRGFRLGPEVAGQGLRGLNEVSLGLKKNSFIKQARFR